MQIALPRLDYLFKRHARNYAETAYLSYLVDVKMEVGENKACARAIFSSRIHPIFDDNFGIKC